MTGPSDDEIAAALDQLAHEGVICLTVAADAGDVVHALRLAGYRIIRHHGSETP